MITESTDFPSGEIGLAFFAVSIIIPRIMKHESFTSETEQLSWEQRLRDAARQQSQSLDIRYATARMQPSYGLRAPDGVWIGITTSESRTSRYPIFSFSDGKPVVMFPGEHRSSDGTISRIDGRPRATFLIDTHVTQPAIAVSSQGEAERIEPASIHYEAFDETDGFHVYKIEKDELKLVDPAEGEYLLWQVSNSELL